jgi:hypothetical protein
VVHKLTNLSSDDLIELAIRHMDLLHHDSVYDTVVDWLRARRRRPLPRPVTLAPVGPPETENEQGIQQCAGRQACLRAAEAGRPTRFEPSDLDGAMEDLAAGGELAQRILGGVSDSPPGTATPDAIYSPLATGFPLR